MIDLAELVCCPRCHSAIHGLSSAHPTCANPACTYSRDGFPVVVGQPVLIDFENSLFGRELFVDRGDSIVARRNLKNRVVGAFHRLATGTNPTGIRCCRQFIDRLKARISSPKILVIGGGAIGLGADQLYKEEAIELIGTDVYASSNTRFVVDGHFLPFHDNSFDGVWIQAVLEHVLEPQRVVDEIHRVLKPQGLVYAETPFMQQVHEQAYDFTRFTMSGHRWLFRRFDQIEAGTVAGAGTAMAWSINYLWRALGAGTTAAMMLTIPFLWLRLIDRMTRRRGNADAACCLYFFGSKSERSLTPKETIAYYAALSPS